MNVIVLVQFATNTKHYVHVHYFPLASVAINDCTVLHNHVTGSYEVCMYSTGALNNGLVAVTNSIFTPLEQVWCTTNHNLYRQPVVFG